MSRSRFFTKPSNWDKFSNTIDKAINTEKQAMFHATAIKKVKSVFKDKCTFLSHSSKDGEVGFIAIMKVNGGKQRFIVTTEGKSANELVAEDYKKLKEVLYERTRSKVNL